jgi:hypothetical protein
MNTLDPVLFTRGKGLTRAGHSEPTQSLTLGEITLSCEPGAQALWVHKPFMSTIGLFARALDPDRALLSADLRALVSAQDTIDPVGAYTLLQYAAPVAPWTPFPQIRSFHSGLSTLIDSSTKDLKRTVHAESWVRPDPASANSPDIDQQATLLESALDLAITDALARAGSRRIISMFSGGADSSLIAERLSRLAPDRTELFHFSEGDDHPETIAAQAIANHLKLPIHIVRGSDAGLDPLLRAGELYPFPFGDHSAIPTRAVVEAALAFGLFGRAAQWDKAARMGPLVHAAAELAFEATSSWSREWRAERFLRLLKRLRAVGPIAASVGQNAVHGSLYLAPLETRRVVSREIDAWMSEALDTTTREVLFAGIDLAHVCTAVFGQKTRPVVDHAGAHIEYPFMAPSVISLALRAAHAWPGRDKPKAPIYHSLARNLPRELVYRPKVGFVIPMTDIFASREFLATLDDAISAGHPYTPLLHTAKIRTLRSMLGARRKLPVQTERFVWMLAFLDRWTQSTLSADGLARTRATLNA